MAEQRTLVIGVGSELRGDDAVGRVVAGRIEALGLPGVEVRSVTQLVPELAEAMASVDRVIVVDAAVDVDRVVGRRVLGQVATPLSHHGDPAGLLALAHLLGGDPEVFVVSVPAIDLSLGSEVSAEGERHAQVALATATRLIGPWAVTASPAATND